LFAADLEQQLFAHTDSVAAASALLLDASPFTYPVAAIAAQWQLQRQLQQLLHRQGPQTQPQQQPPSAALFRGLFAAELQQQLFAHTDSVAAASALQQQEGHCPWQAAPYYS
jgi:hypothetical protein